MTNIHFIEAMLRFLLCKRALTKLWNSSVYLKRHFDSRSGCTFFLFFLPYILSQFCKCKMWEIRFRSSGCCFSIFCFVFISLTTADRSFQCWCRKKMLHKKIIIFIIKSVLLHERTIKWPINSFSFSLVVYFADIFQHTEKIFASMSIGKWKIYGHD